MYRTLDILIIKRYCNIFPEHNIVMVYFTAGSLEKYSFVLQLNILFILRHEIIFDSRIACLAMESLTERDQIVIRFPGFKCSITIQLNYSITCGRKPQSAKEICLWFAQ